MISFTERIPERHELPIAAGVRLLYPERAILKFCKSRSVDLGALCYLDRDVSHTNRVNHRFGTFEPTRVNQVRQLIEIFSDLMKDGAHRPMTIHTFCRDLNIFMGWCDAGDHRQALDSVLFAKHALSEYADHLRDKIARNAINRNQASNSLRSCAAALNLHFGVEDITDGVRCIASKKEATESTKVPSEEAQAKLLGWCESLFDGLTELVLRHQPYPFRIGVPSYIGWPGNSMYIFPVLDFFRTPMDQKKSCVWDYENGRIKGPREVFEQRNSLNDEPSKWARQNAWSNVGAATKVLALANASNTADVRVSHAFVAIQAFFTLFLAETGMNLEQLIDLPWNNDASRAASNPATERQGFRSIKYRAAGRNVNFEIGAAFLPRFRCFLDLRDYVLAGIDSPWLFFSLDSEQAPEMLSKQVVILLHKRITRLDPSMESVSPRQWRAAKQDWLISNCDPAITATVMQHSLDTTLRCYSNGTDTVHQSEMSDFLQRVDKIVVDSAITFSHGKSTSVGLCSDIDTPHSIASGVPVNPDCITTEGCLFCDKYRVHADETDARKLLSCRYCLRKTASLAISEDHYESIFGVVLNRIDSVVDAVRERDTDMVARVEQEVDVDGELDSYWAIKLEKLMELGLI